jgi:translation initiation factor 2 subunit 2
MTEYEKLLDEAYKKIKVVVGETGERFKVPEMDVFVEGSKTIIINFSQICNHLRRKPEHLSKFLSKELAAYSLMDGDRLILNRKLPKAKINDKILLYVKDFVICKECKKPDTEIIKQDNFSFIHCLACGAKRSISKI